MKFDVRYRPTGGVFHRGLPLTGKGKLHLAETAVIIEGYLAAFTVPLVWSFYRRLVCQWSTRTIPYTRILTYKYSGNWIVLTPARIILAVGLSVLLGAYSYSLSLGPTRMDMGMVSLFVGGPYAVLLLFLLFMGRRAYRLTYRLPDGTSCLVQWKVVGRAFSGGKGISHTAR